MSAVLARQQGNVPAYVRNRKLIAWVAEIAAADEARSRRLVRRLAGGVRPALRGNGRRRHAEDAEPGQAAEQLPGAVGSERRRARRRPHVHLQRSRRTTPGPTNNWMAAGRDARHAERAVRRLHARPHDVRDPVFDGAARLAHQPDRRRDFGQPVRRRQHAHHDAHGTRGRRTARHRRRLRAVRALGRQAAGVRRKGCGVAVQPDEVHRSLPGDARDLVVTARATAATRCSARSAWRCASPRRWGATRAGWPSTC